MEQYYTSHVVLKASKIHFGKNKQACPLPETMLIMIITQDNPLSLKAVSYWNYFLGRMALMLTS